MLKLFKREMARYYSHFLKRKIKETVILKGLTTCTCWASSDGYNRKIVTAPPTNINEVKRQHGVRMYQHTLQLQHFILVILHQPVNSIYKNNAMFAVV